MYREGQTATNPKTGQKLVFKGGQWVNAGGDARPAVRLTPQEEIQLKELREGASQAGDFARQAEQFADLNRETSTGPIYKIPGASEVMSVFNPKLAQMDALTARMAPAQRVPGSGTTSDRDLNLFMRAVPNIDRPGAANAALASDMTGTAVRRTAQASFFDAYAKKNGTLKGAQAAFETYWNTRGKGFVPGAKKPVQRPQSGGGYKILSVE